MNTGWQQLNTSHTTFSAPFRHRTAIYLILHQYLTSVLFLFVSSVSDKSELLLIVNPSSLSPHPPHHSFSLLFSFQTNRRTVFSLFPIRASHPSFPVVYPPLIFLSFCLFPVKVSSSSQPITFQNQFLKLRKAIKITFKEPFSSSISDVAFLNPCLTCDQVTISFIPSHC